MKSNTKSSNFVETAIKQYSVETLLIWIEDTVKIQRHCGHTFESWFWSEIG